MITTILDDRRGVAEDLLVYKLKIDQEASMHDTHLSNNQLSLVERALLLRGIGIRPEGPLLRFLGQILSKVDQRLRCGVFWHMQLDELFDY